MKLPPRPTWDRTISGLLGIHFSMSVIACFHQLSVSAPVNIPHFSEPLGRAGSRVNQFWGFALQRVNFENVTGLRRNRLISIIDGLELHAGSR